MKPGMKFIRNSERKNNWNTAETIQPHFNRTRLKSTVRLKLEFNRTSTALQTQSFGKEFARTKYLVRR